MRNSLRYITHNETIPLNQRLQAQMRLQLMPRYFVKGLIKDRCTETGKVNVSVSNLLCILVAHSIRTDLSFLLFLGIYGAIQAKQDNVEEQGFSRVASRYKEGCLVTGGVVERISPVPHLLTGVFSFIQVNETPLF